MKQIIGARPPPATGGAKLVQVDEESAGQRLDNFLLRQLKGVPKTHVYRIIRSGEVRVNKGRAAADTRVAAGDTVRLPPVRISEAVAAKAELPVPAREFPVLFEDEHLLAVDKPAGVAVHGGSGVSFGVIEQLRRARPAARLLELVHRLDRETSGILLVAKKRSALLALQDQFRQRETGKTYLALVVGAWPASQEGDRRAAAQVPAGRRRAPGQGGGAGRPGRHALDHAGEGGAAYSLSRLRERAGVRVVGTLLEVTIKTGRTHQIRVHLASPVTPSRATTSTGTSN